MTTGTWEAIGLEIYESDDLGNLGTWIATARDITVAARMADTHNSMLAALKDVRGLVAEAADLHALRDEMEQITCAAIAKAEGTKP